MSARTAEASIDQHADWRDVYAGRVRAIEELYIDVHTDLIEWGRWGRERFPGKPRLMLSGVWIMTGDPDPNSDPNAPPATRMPPFDELRIFSLDARINSYGFPSIWAAILRANYVRQLPEYQRHIEARTQPETYIEQLSNALDFLRTT